MSHAHDRCALILIDCQQGFKDWDHWVANRNNPALERNLLKLLNHWRTHQLPIAHVVHHSRDVNSLLRRDKSSGEIWPELTPKVGEKLIVKSENSSSIGTNLEVYLRRNHNN